MSRQRDQFKYRTTVFEGAYRAWSHLGGLELKDLETKSVDELTSTLDNYIRPMDVKDGCSDDTIKSNSDSDTDFDASELAEIEFGAPVPYEPLPRKGVGHPFVRTILEIWLGDGFRNSKEVEKGLMTLRTWWQHRRKGESKSARLVLGKRDQPKMVEYYMARFFHVAHSQITVNGEQAPRTLMRKHKEAIKARPQKRGRKRKIENRSIPLPTERTSIETTDETRNQVASPSVCQPVPITNERPSVESTEVSNQVASRGPFDAQSKIRHVTMYRDGFIVKDGPFRRIDDPSSINFLRAVQNGEIPFELKFDESGAPLQGEITIGWFDKRRQDYVEPSQNPNQETSQEPSQEPNQAIQKASRSQSPKADSLESQRQKLIESMTYDAMNTSISILQKRNDELEEIVAAQRNVILSQSKEVAELRHALATTSSSREAQRNCHGLGSGGISQNATNTYISSWALPPPPSIGKRALFFGQPQ